MQPKSQSKTSRERQLLQNLLETSIKELKSEKSLDSLQRAVDEENHHRNLLTDTLLR